MGLSHQNEALQASCDEGYWKGNRCEVRRMKKWGSTNEIGRETSVWQLSGGV